MEKLSRRYVLRLAPGAGLALTASLPMPAEASPPEPGTPLERVARLAAELHRVVSEIDPTATVIVFGSDPPGVPAYTINCPGIGEWIKGPKPAGEA